MGTPKYESVEEREYAKNFFEKKEKESLDKAAEVHISIKKDLNSIKGITDHEKEEILRKIHDYADYTVSAYQFFKRSKEISEMD